MITYDVNWEKFKISDKYINRTTFAVVLVWFLRYSDGRHKRKYQSAQA